MEYKSFVLDMGYQSGEDLPPQARDGWIYAGDSRRLARCPEDKKTSVSLPTYRLPLLLILATTEKLPVGETKRKREQNYYHTHYY